MPGAGALGWSRRAVRSEEKTKTKKTLSDPSHSGLGCSTIAWQGPLLRRPRPASGSPWLPYRQHRVGGCVMQCSPPWSQQARSPCGLPWQELEKEPSHQVSPVTVQCLPGVAGATLLPGWQRPPLSTRAGGRPRGRRWTNWPDPCSPLPSLALSVSGPLPLSSHHAAAPGMGKNGLSLVHGFVPVRGPGSGTS